MKKLNIVLAVAALMAFTGSSFAGFTVPPSVPDSCSTSLLLTLVAGGIGLARKFKR